MLIALHKNATTTPATRRALQQASGTDRELAQQYGIGLDTVRKWRHRTTVHDASHTPHRLQTTLNAAQEELVVYLRTHCLPCVSPDRLDREIYRLREEKKSLEEIGEALGYNKSTIYRRLNKLPFHLRGDR